LAGDFRLIVGASVQSMAPSPRPAHRTGRADFPHPALGQGLMRSLADTAWRCRGRVGAGVFAEKGVRGSRRRVLRLGRVGAGSGRGRSFDMLGTAGRERGVVESRKETRGTPLRGHYEQAGLAQPKTKCKKLQPLGRRKLRMRRGRKMAKRVVELACIKRRCLLFRGQGRQ
jgi:hypothetical protein